MELAKEVENEGREVGGSGSGRKIGRGERGRKIGRDDWAKLGRER